jgi:hypothetical protein
MEQQMDLVASSATFLFNETLIDKTAVSAASVVVFPSPSLESKYPSTPPHTGHLAMILNIHLLCNPSCADGIQQDLVLDAPHILLKSNSQIANPIISALFSSIVYFTVY